MDRVSLVKWCLRVLLFALFVWHSWEMFYKYVNQKTLILEEKVGVESSRMPDLTLCSLEPYKTEGFHHNQSSFEANTYTFDDLFLPSTINYLNEKNFSIKETRAYSQGLCFTLSSPHEFRSPTERLTLVLRPGGPGVTVQLHESGADFWLTSDNWPVAIYEQESEELEQDSVACKIETEIYVLRSMWNGEFACNDWGKEDDLESNKEFFDCAKKSMRKAVLRDNFTCSNVWTEQYFPDNTKECDFEKDFDEVYRLGEWMEESEGFPHSFSAQPGNFGCPRPCRQHNFVMNCEEQWLGNSYLDLDGERETEGVRVTFFMKLLVESEVQQLLYDISGIVAGVGGSLTLFLGFSCLEIGEKGLDVMFERLKGRKGEEKAKSPPTRRSTGLMSVKRTIIVEPIGQQYE